MINLNLVTLLNTLNNTRTEYYKTASKAFFTSQKLASVVRDTMYVNKLNLKLAKILGVHTTLEDPITGIKLGVVTWCSKTYVIKT